MDGIVPIKVQKNATFVGFADDVSIAVKAKALREIVDISKATIAAAKQWQNAKSLTLADHKKVATSTLL